MGSSCLQWRCIIAEFATTLFLDGKFLIERIQLFAARGKKYNDVLKASVQTCGFPSMVINGPRLVLPRHADQCYFALGEERGKCSFPKCILLC